MPVEGNETRDDIEIDEKTGRAARKGPIYVVSHPREFRKPNYLMALATGKYMQLLCDCEYFVRCALPFLPQYVMWTYDYDATNYF